MKIGDRVCYIHNDTEAAKETGWYPTIGTHGTVVDADATGYQVKWDNGALDGEWWCDFDDVKEVYHYCVEVLIGTRRFACDCNDAESALEALNDIFNAMPHTKRNGVNFKVILDEMESGERISYNVCPIAICRINGEC